MCQAKIVSRQSLSSDNSTFPGNSTAFSRALMFKTASPLSARTVQTGRQKPLQVIWNLSPSVNANAPPPLQLALKMAIEALVLESTISVPVRKQPVRRNFQLPTADSA